VLKEAVLDDAFQSADSALQVRFADAEELGGGAQFFEDTPPRN
jgi:hypothetical protein